MASLRRVYWDAAVWIALENGEPTRVKAVESGYEAAKRGTVDIFTSTISYVEVFRLVSEQCFEKPLPQDGLDKIAEALEQDFIKLVPVDMEIGRNARKLRRELTKFEGAADSIHLASALRWHVDEMLTYDKGHLLHLSGKIKDHNGNLLKICEPVEPAPTPKGEADLLSYVEDGTNEKA